MDDKKNWKPIHLSSEIEIQKNQECNRIILMRNLMMEDIDALLEEIDVKPETISEKVFGYTKKSISKFRFKAKLTIELLKDDTENPDHCDSKPICDDRFCLIGERCNYDTRNAQY